ncbi:MAG: hypothetical protein IPJ55_16115 [Chloracidobacterium sp.]|nr:hypothetical protein [Chloracidobacterium sp.]
MKRRHNKCQGIFRLLKSFGVDLTNEMPYHETLTVFWMKSVNEFNKDNESSSLFDKANNLIANHDKDLPLKFYTREHLFPTSSGPIRRA